MNVRIIIRVLGLLLVVEGLAMLLSLVVALIYKGPDATAFLLSSLICFIPGAAGLLSTQQAVKQITKREGFIIVTLVWVVFSFFGTLPYVLSGAIPNFTNAFFETISGFTTTGSSILENIEELPHGILFWRSLTQWLGGMGIIVLTLSFMPIFGIGGMQLFAAEMPGPTPDKISPKLHHTARNLWLLYLMFTIVETLLLRLGGLTWFDSMAHSLTTMATGGFSTKQASIAHYDSAYVQYVIILFMIIAGTNFSLTFMVLKGRFSKLLFDEEFRFYLTIIVSFTLVIFAGIMLTMDRGSEQAFREALFQVVSILTTTGFATTDYLLWPPVLVLLLFSLFFFGGSAGSTGGGIKIMRIVLLLKNGYYELKRLIHPHAVIPIRFNRHSVEPRMITNVLAFFMFYLIIFFISTIFMTLFIPDLDSAMGAVATSLGNIGPGLGSVGPDATFLHIPSAGKWFLSFLMLLGRLELFTVLVLFSPSFWKF